MGCGAVDGLFTAITGRQFRRRRCIICRMWLFAKCLTWAGMYQGWMCLQPVHGRRCPTLLRHTKVCSAHVTHIRITLKFKQHFKHTELLVSPLWDRAYLLLPAALNLSCTSRASHSHKGRTSLLTMTCWYLYWSGAS